MYVEYLKTNGWSHASKFLLNLRGVAANLRLAGYISVGFKAAARAGPRRGHVKLAPGSAGQRRPPTPGLIEKTRPARRPDLSENG